MPAHRLVPDGGPKDAEWLLEWDTASFTLRDPDGRVEVEVPAAHAHRRFDLRRLDAESKFALATPRGFACFKPRRNALRDLRALVEANLRSDDEFRVGMARDVRRLVRRSLAAFLVGGGPFASYCWLASWAPDPPPGHWVRWFGPLIHLALTGLMGLGIAGACGLFVGLRQLARVRRAERNPPSGRGSV